MLRKKLFAVIAVIAAFSLLFAACGAKNEEVTHEASAASAAAEGTEILGLTEWSLTASTWSSPNGATVNLTATPAGYVSGQTAAFVVRLEGEEIANVPCEWNGAAYTASADLNSADGYCYYVIMNSPGGTQIEVPVNVPTDPVDETLINMASSLESQCSLVVENSAFDGKWLTLTGGSVQVIPPKIVNEGENITCSSTMLILDVDGEEVSRVEVAMPTAGTDGIFILPLTDTSLEVPALEDDQQLAIRLEVTLSNGQILTAEGGSWFFNSGNLVMAVG